VIRISGSVYPDNKPLFLQIKEKIEDQIVNDQLLEGEQVPSTTQLSSFYKSLSSIEAGPSSKTITNR